MNDLWKNTLERVKGKCPTQSGIFELVFDNSELEKIEDGVASVSLKNAFLEKNFRTRFHDFVLEALKELGQEVKGIKLVTKKTASKPREAARSGRVASTGDLGREMVNTLNKTRLEQGASRQFNSGLNETYTLENFVVGSNNDLAVGVARNIIDQPGGTMFNPFFLYAKPGLGKTHLVQAIGNEILKTHPDKKVLYVTTNTFYSEFISLIQKKKGDEFSQKYKNVDVLIIDDIQMIIGKDKSQEEFFNIFNHLYEHHKQIIVTCDRLPNELQQLDERLSSRLAMGGAYDLQMPNFEERCAILRAKADFDGYEIEDEAVEYVANKIKTNIRELNGALSQLLTTAYLRGLRPIDVISEGMVSLGGGTAVRAVAPQSVLNTVAKYYGMTKAEMCSKSRQAQIKNARQVSMYLLNKELKMSQPKIAAELGMKDHTTVLHGVRKIEADLKVNYELREQVEQLKEQIYG